MEIKPVSEILSTGGFSPPDLEVIRPNADNYHALLLQPKGEIEFSNSGIQNKNRELADKQFGAFLDDALESNADLVVTPEYSMPWDTLLERIRGDRGPSDGKLWVLGCESTSYSTLESIKSSIAPHATVLFEELVADETKFIDPLVYVFVTSKSGDTEQTSTVLLVQMKTCPMADPGHKERNGMLPGKIIYRIGEQANQVSLISLICSDALDFLDEQAKEVYDRTLLIHIQLNPKPKHREFRTYRDRLLRFEGNETELICLNWARNVKSWEAGQSKNWKNISGSAWYTKSHKFDSSDEALCSNHRLGLYYAWLQSFQVHALYFNYNPAVFSITATKVFHHAVGGVVSRRRGPQSEKVSEWHNENIEWTELTIADDEFTTVVEESGNAKVELKKAVDRNPFEAERILALSVGKVENESNWHDVRFLDSCSIDQTESIRRMTFCQDPDSNAQTFRVGRLRRLGHLWNILHDKSQLPMALSDFRDGFRWNWAIEHPHQNATSNQGNRATVIYAGEDASETQLTAVSKRVSEFLHRSYSDPNKSRTARQRFALWFRNSEGAIEKYGKDELTNFSKTGDQSEFDIARES